MANSRTLGLIKTYRASLEGDDTPDENVLWHILRDLLEWSDDRNLDLQCTLEEAQADLRETAERAVA